MILINFASRSRPVKMFYCLENLRSFSTLYEYKVLLKLDLDDASCNNEATREGLKYFPECQIEWGYSESKVSAINRNIGSSLEMWDILINLSDDQLFTVKGFDEIIKHDMDLYFKDRDGFLHYPDTKTGNKIPTMSIMGRKYFDRDGYVYHPSFLSVFADNFAMDVAKKRGKYMFLDKSIYIHKHPAYGLAEWDAQYKKTESKEFYQKDRETYLLLKENYH
jgi:hypothetical protein